MCLKRGWGNITDKTFCDEDKSGRKSRQKAQSEIGEIKAQNVNVFTFNINYP